MKSDRSRNLEIARSIPLEPIHDVLKQSLGLDGEALELYGRYKAKLPLDLLRSLDSRRDGKLILVSAMSPTTAGEGKTTSAIGLVDGLWKVGKRAALAIREPSLGPCFGMKGGATGGGYAQVVPMEDINLHFTGDFHAVTSAHNLLTAMVDNHLYWSHSPPIDPRRLTWRRVLDMNDRALRQIICGLGGGNHGLPRESGFDITAASEVMAILCLATDLRDLQRRLGQIVVGRTPDGALVHARDLKADGGMAALLRQAFQPNVVQTLEHNPAFIHGGPFGNIAHGCSSIVATRAALKLADYVVTEAGFGADLGAEKFFNIVCRKTGLMPACVVLVATVRALALHGGTGPESRDDREDQGAVEKGLSNLERHIECIQQFGVPIVVAINRFETDTEAELEQIQKACQQRGVPAVCADHWAHGGDGAIPLAREVLQTVERSEPAFRLLYQDDLPLLEKVRTIVRKIYRGRDVEVPRGVRAQFEDLEARGFGSYPVCIAKTQYSFSTDPRLKGAPEGFSVPIREVRLSAGAEFVVVLTGDLLTMPGLPKEPAVESVTLDEQGEIRGLF